VGLTSAMYTGLSGLDANQTAIETIGHNIANVNTTAFKGSRTLFQTQFAQTWSMGTPPSDSSGGTNPTQIGLGTLVGSIQRDSSPGSLQTTGIPSDLAIEGSGYFVVQDSAGRTFYTRAGSFSLNSAHQLVTPDGKYVRGFGVDQNYAIIPGTLQNLNVPEGQMSITRATQNVVMDGDLSAADTIATQGAQLASQVLVDGTGAVVAPDTPLTDLRSADAPGTVLFADGDVITVSGATRGGRDVPAQQFTVGTTGSTAGDFATWLQGVLGIQTDPALAGQPGVTLEGGALTIRSNAGEPNAIHITADDVTTTNTSTPLPFQFTQTADATGTGVFTSFTVYDSLGNPVQANVTFTLDSTPATGPVWRYLVEVPGDGTAPPTRATGTVAFDTAGNFIAATGNQITIDRTGTGAASPMTVTLDFSNVNGQSTAVSNVIMADQDGYPPGTLDSFAVGEDGTITGIFSNGLSRTLGQVALATFTNEGGLVAETENLFSAGPNSGTAQIVAPGTQGAGSIHGGALEMSNVDLSREFIGLITASTGFQAAGRVITVANDMLNQLLLTLR
jgi:flagellar hook protein FlgE